MYRLIIKPLAEQDIKDAAHWYNERNEGLGNDFLLALEAALNVIQRNPNQYQFIYKEVKRAFTTRFPYGIYFITHGNVIYVLGVVHTSRNPRLWRKRK